MKWAMIGLTIGAFLGGWCVGAAREHMWFERAIATTRACVAALQECAADLRSCEDAPEIFR